MEYSANVKVFVIQTVVNAIRHSCIVIKTVVSLRVEYVIIRNQKG